jgi:hypothetical protein
MKILYRACENLYPVNDPRPEWCNTTEFKSKCFKSLIDSIHDQNVQLYIIGDKLAEETIERILSTYSKAIIVNSDDNLGNQQSLYKMFELAETFEDETDIVYFCEDDYLYVQDFYSITRNFFENVENSFENVFFHPTDYPDQYLNSRMRKNYIFKNGSRGWYREVDSTTFTFACRVKTFNKFSALLKDCAIKRKIAYDNLQQPVFNYTGADDARFSEIFGYKNPCGNATFHQIALCFCPLPGIASHMHQGTESLHFDWRNLYNSIKLKYGDNGDVLKNL